MQAVRPLWWGEFVGLAGFEGFGCSESGFCSADRFYGLGYFESGFWWTDFTGSVVLKANFIMRGIF